MGGFLQTKLLSLPLSARRADYPSRPCCKALPQSNPHPHHLPHPPALTFYLLNLLYSALLLLAPADRNYTLPFIHASPNFASIQTLPACCRSRSVSCHPPVCACIQLPVDVRCYRPRYPHLRDHLRRGASQPSRLSHKHHTLAPVVDTPCKGPPRNQLLSHLLSAIRCSDPVSQLSPPAT